MLKAILKWITMFNQVRSSDAQRRLVAAQQELRKVLNDRDLLLQTLQKANITIQALNARKVGKHERRAKRTGSPVNK